MVRALVGWRNKRKGKKTEDSELGGGNLFSTGLVAGGALAGVVVALLQVNDNIAAKLGVLSIREKLIGALGDHGYDILGVCFFLGMAAILYRVAMMKEVTLDE